MKQPTTTFESCNLRWLPCDPETVKPDWLPEDAKVRGLTETERVGKANYYNVEFLFCDLPEVPCIGWYPVDESLVPPEYTGVPGGRMADVATLDETLAAVDEWQDELGMSAETGMKVKHFVEWYYAQTTKGEPKP